MIVGSESFISRSFDYIVVGGGTAGLALASRLSEDSSVIVGVVEAGNWDPNLDRVNVPGLCGSLVGDAHYDWAFTSVPQSNLNNRQIYQPRGKGLGGTSMMNLLALTRAAAREYNALEVLGNPGWNWRAILEFMKKSESTVVPPEEHIMNYSLMPSDARWHGDSGPIKKSYPTYFNSLHKAFVATLELLGVPWNPDASNGCNVGTALNHSSYDAGSAVRSYSANAYYEPVADRKNLLILTGALVSKIAFDRSRTPLVATGVEFMKGDVMYMATSRREVILSAGSFQTPMLLELSGIGNREILYQHGIDTLLDLPGVGENLQVISRLERDLQDHLFVTTIHEIDSRHDTLDVVEGDPQPKEYLASPPAALFGFLPAKAFMGNEQREQWKAIVTSATQEAPASLKKQYELQTEWFEDSSVAEGEVVPFPGFFRLSGLKTEPNKRYSSMVATSMHPLSRGSVHIASADPTVPPRIDPNYLSNPADAQVLVGVLKFALKAYRTGPLGGAVRKQVAPSVEESASDEALLEYVKNTCSSTYHPLGTAAMLPVQDGGVVGPDLIVHGTANLRVVDASILPMQISAHTQATVYAIAEKAADIIKSAM
ncbi:GMC oxidoreductase [Trametes coccinea BRFM310]|uniref:GMC oxidoreductase n=1 Tax=Trametes coccinea (strain BRFM310) TaxID=1353009 RepID=A0A1Y2J737_TRAC3|nr:GMC oxidoreductase [Trametes coccinea BRFM310]